MSSPAEFVGFTDGSIGIFGNDNVAAGNYVGTDATGTKSLTAPGDIWGVFVSNGSCNRIGVRGSDPDPAAEANLISGNGGGGVLLEGGVQNVVAGNFIGTDATGTQALGNGKVDFGAVATGVVVSGGSGNRIGTDGDGVGDAAKRNIISGNIGDGVGIGDSTDNVVAGNFIGTDFTGTLPLGNSLAGVTVNGSFEPDRHRRPERRQRRRGKSDLVQRLRDRC